jgi:hypothetical protein
MIRKILFIGVILTAATTMSGCRLFSRPADNMNDPFVQRVMQGSAIKEVRYKGKIWRVCMAPNTYATVGETMYTEEEVWKKTIEEQRFTYLRGLIAHESVHTARQLQSGVTVWMIGYFLSPSFRWEEERIAYETEWKVQVAGGFVFVNADYITFANDVSGSMYYGMTDYNTAYSFIKDTIAKIQEELKK